MIVDNEGFWDFIERASDAYDTDVELPDGGVIRAGGRDLRVVARPGHSTTDALFVDERERIAFVGDHLLGRDLVQHGGLPGLRAGRDASAGTRRVPPEPAADGRHAAAPGC